MKDYKKILEGVVDIINTTEKSDIGFANICTYIGENCPELAESENERIRKRIIHALHGDVLEMSEIKEAVDWLEKQGEHAKFTNGIQVGDRVTRNEDGVLFNLSQLNRVAKKDEKQGEQKLTELTNSQFVEKCKGLSDLEKYVLSLVPTRPIDAIKVDARTIRYLVEQEQKPAWSEEDDKIIEEIINDIECARAINYHAPKEDYEFRENWLKSLRPQNKWKPSEEQMKTLEYYAKLPDHSKVLLMLYNDLKKLTE